MNNHTIKVLEYQSILDKLSSLCASIPGKKLARGLYPIVDKDIINRRLDLVSEMVDIIRFDSGVPQLQFGDLASRLESAMNAGDIFEPLELLEFDSFLLMVAECQKIKPKFPGIHEIISGLVYPEDLHLAIQKSIDISGEIKDTASAELKSIRKELAGIKTKLDERFEKYLRSDVSGYLSDNVFTIREGRYVLPVREMEKGHVKGIIHDRSSSGATFFIEPSETVELNNRHRELETAEREEINRILRNLTNMLFADVDSIRNDVAILSHIDYVAGCARLAIALNCSRPKISDDHRMTLENACHPILMLSRLSNDSDDSAPVVPLSISFDDDNKIIIITGPNTGGKTVALKTIGLLSLMAQSGLFITADQKTTLVVFNKIFADIGDEQSLETSLSTYSSHLLQIKTALEKCDENTLILFDELGAGTDPEEGSAIGQAVVEQLAGNGCYGIITTHHGKLKTLAGNIPGVTNCSMEFDSESLSPTFRLKMGIPGSSYAVEIAQKLGLPKSLINRAWELLDKKERELTSLIADLNHKASQLSDEIERAKAGRLSYESLAKIYSEKLEAFQKTEKESRKNILKKSEELIRETRIELDRLLEEARAKRTDREIVRNIRRDVSERLQRTQKQLDEFRQPETTLQARGLLGEKVYIREIDADGEVLEPADSAGRVRVKVGNVTMLTDLENLLKRGAQNTAQAKISSEQHGSVRTDYSPEPGLEIDLRGMTFEEAEPVLQRYIDDSCNAGMETITIIHGKGTGALRKKVQDYLSVNPRIETYRLGHWNEGSSGVTMATLKKDW